MATAIAASSSLTAQTPARPVVSDQLSQTLSPGDQVRITVFRQEEMSCDCVISGNGTVLHPLYRDIPVVGVPLSVVEDRLRSFLTKYLQNPQFVILPLVKVVVRGEVRSPNIYSVPTETTIAQAIMLAGGPTDQGLISKVQVIRDRQRINLNLSDPTSDAVSLPVRSNDQIIIGKKRTNPLTYVWPVMSSVSAIAAIANLLR
jgi:polysaccharide export outer membrane protein